jgi:outer membrane protein TolC
VVLGIPADLLRRRPDIRAVEREVAAQSAQIGIATAELYPHVSITGSIYFDSMRFKDLFNGNSMSGNVGPSFNWNILNYGRLVNNIRLQDARFQELVYTYQDTVLKANAEVEAALVNFLQSQQEVKYLAVSTAAATESVELVRDQYDAGKTDFNRVLTVEQQLTQQEDTLASAQGSVVQSLVQLYKALGGGWQIRLWGNGTPSDAATEAAPAESPNEVDVKQPGLDEPQENIAAPSPASANATSSKRPLPLPPAPVAQ